ncbi:hypothetical protein [Dietzia sp. SYD-A1]|uniref:hypothetical protein n=1 Tax=Dietzia sp. SYD-A1 TaxID=2780141 RepID=UPI00189188BC|nr:hypothetical protein [Dietzia sp. SYD-A1]
MVVKGSQPEAENSLFVAVDELQSIRIEDAPSEVWDEARKFYGQQPFELIGTYEGGGQAGYNFEAIIDP